MSNSTRPLLAAFLIPVFLAVVACGGSSDPKKPAPSTAKTTTAAAASPYGYEYDGSGANLEASQFGDDWPLTVDGGRVNCSRIGSGGVEAVFTSDDDKRYALNGTAKNGAAENGYLMIDEIWAANPEVKGAKKDIRVLIDVCKPMM